MYGTKKGAHNPGPQHRLFLSLLCARSGKYLKKAAVTRVRQIVHFLILPSLCQDWQVPEKGGPDPGLRHRRFLHLHPAFPYR